MPIIGEDIVVVNDLHKYYYNVHILKGINLTVKKGQLISIIGRSGCGKTTFLRCLNCLEILDSGSIRVAGITLNRKNPIEPMNKEFIEKAKAMRRKVIMPLQKIEPEENLDDELKLKVHTLRTRVGMLFQNLNLFPHLTVLENVAKPLMIVKKEPKEKAQEIAEYNLHKVGLDAFTNRYPYQLSGGQAQRVAIARALAMSPQVMLYDEPTSALDPELVGEVLNVMENLHYEGMTQIIVTHAMNFARNASDLVVYMEDGRIIEVSPPEEIFTNPKCELTKKYLSMFLD